MCGLEVAPLLQAMRHGNRGAVTALLASGARPKFLHDAVETSTLAIVDDLLKDIYIYQICKPMSGVGVASDPHGA